MSETKHTPGPWNICEDVNSEGLTGDLICTLNDDERDVGESEANARLVAAAPDMLEALKAEELAKSLHRAAALDDDPQKMKKVAILYAKSNRLRRAALAKAGAASSLDYTLTEIEIDQESYVVSPEPRGMALSLNNGFDTVEEALSNDNGADFPTSYGVCSVFMRAGGSPLVFATDKIAFDALKRSTGWDTEVDGEVLIMRCEGGCVRVDTINGSTLFFSYWSVDPAAECGGQHAR